MEKIISRETGGGKDLEKKQFLTYDEQIRFLEEKKGLTISDKEYAKKILLKIGYFPLINGYKEVFKKSTTNQFQKGISFASIYICKNFLPSDLLFEELKIK